MAAEAARWRFTVDDYHRMVKAGILTADDRVELLDGEIIAWLVDLEGEALERHTNPAEEGYGLVLRARRGETVASTVLPELAFPVTAVLG